VFERFTERARQVVVFAQDEARSLKHNYIGTEHLLLGLLREEEGIGGRVLESFGIAIEAVRGEVARIIGEGDEVTSGEIPFTPRAKKVLELSMREALSLGHNYIGTEHILLGLARENEGVAGQILTDQGVTARDVAAKTIELIGGAETDDYSETFSTHFTLTREMPRRVSDYGARSARVDVSVVGAVFLGWLMFAIAAAVGVLVGWLIWG
jgi:ATP-dependent Clp protease ATP-binding subunit ClpA